MVHGAICGTRASLNEERPRVGGKGQTMATYAHEDMESIASEITLAVHHLGLHNSTLWDNFVQAHMRGAIQSETDVLVFALGCAVSALCGAKTPTAPPASDDTVAALDKRIRTLEEAGYRGVWRQDI